MAEDQNSGGGEKEFEATEQKKRQARKEGNVAQSKEATSFSLMLGMVIASAVFGTVLAGGIFNDFSAMFYHADSFAEDTFSGSGEASREWIFGLLKNNNKGALGVKRPRVSLPSFFSRCS